MCTVSIGLVYWIDVEVAQINAASLAWTQVQLISDGNYKRKKKGTFV